MSPLIIGLTGAAGSGKDTAARIIVAGHSACAYAFADPLRSMLAILIGYAIGYDDTPENWLTDRELKEREIPVIGASGRRLMQTLGTEWGRKLINPSLWIDLMRARIADASEHPRVARGEVPIIITDVRFDNEAQLIRELGGEVWLMLGRHQTVADHPSENGVSAHLVDRQIDNSGDLEHLRDQIGAAWGRMKAARHV